VAAGHGPDDSLGRRARDAAAVAIAAAQRVNRAALRECEAAWDCAFTPHCGRRALLLCSAAHLRVRTAGLALQLAQHAVLYRGA
jgi:hypothetical protein